MTVALIVVAVALIIAVAMVRRFGVGPAIDRALFGDPEALRFGPPLPDTSIDYAKRESQS